MYTPLLIVCILSFIGATCGIFYGFGLIGVSAMSHTDIQNALAAAGFGDDGQLIGQMQTLIALGPWFVVFNIVEIVGVALVLRRMWAGFHVYAVSQIGLAGLMVISVGFSGALVSILWSAAWVLIYYNLMRRASVGSDDPDGSSSGESEI